MSALILLLVIDLLKFVFPFSLILVGYIHINVNPFLLDFPRY